MKVLKNNFNTETNISKPNIVPRYPRKYICENCESELEYNKEDIYIGVYGASHIKCPLCEYENMIDDENTITLTKNNIEFPTHFNYSSEETGAKKCCDNENVKKEINRAIEYFRQNKDEWHWYTCYGNLHISVDRLKGDENYDVFVTDRHWETYIPFEQEDY